MTTTSNSAQQSHLKSRGWRQRLTASGLLLVSPALLAVGIATAAHANASSVTGANLTGGTSISGNAVQPTTHTAFPRRPVAILRKYKAPSAANTALRSTIAIGVRRPARARANRSRQPVVFLKHA
jgi:hypothetical protein